MYLYMSWMRKNIHKNPFSLLAIGVLWHWNRNKKPLFCLHMIDVMPHFWYVLYEVHACNIDNLIPDMNECKRRKVKNNFFIFRKKLSPLNDKEMWKQSEKKQPRRFRDEPYMNSNFKLKFDSLLYNSIILLYMT